MRPTIARSDKMKAVVIFVLLFLIFQSDAAPAATTDKQVKNLIRRYEQVEAQLDRSVHYFKKDVAGDETTIEQAWFNGAGDVIKVATEHTGPASRELTEYFAPDFDHADSAMFMLYRKETAQADGTKQVDESRKYFGETVVNKKDGEETNSGQTIRELTKSGRFKPGEPLDTVHIPNVAVDLAKRSADQRNQEEQMQAQYNFFFKPQKIAESLQQSGPPDSDPFANVKGDSEKFRVIHGTASPDGRYAIALGLARDKIDWEDFRDKELETGDKIYTAEEDDRLNYVVDLPHQRILEKTGCQYFGTKRSYNYRDCVVTWSPDSRTFVQVTSSKWSYDECRAGRITADQKLLGTVDLGKYAEKAASGFLATHKHGKYQGSIAISASEVTNDSLIGLEVTGQEASGERKGDTDFSVDESIRLRETPSGLRLETVNVRNAPQE